MHGRVAPRMMRVGWWLFLTSSLSLLWTLNARAQSNFEGGLLGGRTTMMAGAAVATGADEATPFMNPAGITRIPGQSFSFSTFALSLSNRTVRGALDPDDRLGIQNPDTADLNLRIVPNTFCLFLDGPPKEDFSSRSRHKYSFCAATAERERFNFAENRFSGRGGDEFIGIAHTTEMLFVRSSVAMSWGMEVGRETNLGVSWRVDNARFQDSSIVGSFASAEPAGSFQSLSLSRRAWSWDTSLIVGITSNITRHVTLGVALTTPSQHLVGHYTGVGTLALGAIRQEGVLQDDGDFRYNHPGNLRLGLGFEWPRVTFEVNGSFYGPQKQRARANFDRRITAFSPDQEATVIAGRDSVVEEGRAVTNVSVGGEYFLKRDFSVLGGVGTDFSGLRARERQPIGDVLFRQNKDQVFASLGVSSYASLGRLLFGVNGSYAWGQLSAANPAIGSPDFASLAQRMWSLQLVLSGQITLRSVKTAAEKAARPLIRSREEGQP